MAFLRATVQFKDGTTGAATVLGSSAAWKCACGEVLFGATVLPPGPCGGRRCGRQFELVRLVDERGAAAVVVMET